MTEPKRHQGKMGHAGHEPLPPGEVLEPPPPTPGEEVNVGAIVRFLVGLTVMTLLVAGLVIFLMRQLAVYEARQDPPIPPLSRPDPARTPAGVRLQEMPFADIERLDRAEAQLLQNYGWVDEKAGVVRLPIDVAMDALVRRGLPVRTAEGTSPLATPTPAASPTPAPRPKPKAPATAPSPATATAAPTAGEAP